MVFMQRISKFFFLVLLIVLGLIGLGYYWTFIRPLPDYEQTITNSQFEQTVSVRWDEWGVPHIKATNKGDAYRALGYIHAQERLWQMTTSQLAIEGRFSEFFGEKALDVDRFFRMVDTYGMAQQIEPMLSEEHRTILNAYTEGINSFIKAHPKNLPIQFSLANIAPFQWNNLHSLALVRLLGWELNVSWWAEVSLEMALQRVSENEQSDLLAPWKIQTGNVSNLNTKENLLAPFLALDEFQRVFTHTQGVHVGSNGWVIDGSKTKSGAPLLAGDPHLALSLPSRWFEVHISINGKNISGATIPGSPIVIVGQNDEMAWTITNVMADDTDFYLESINPLDRGQYLKDSLNGPTYAPFSYDRSYIATKEGAQVAYEIRKTERGPIISDLYPSTLSKELPPISMQWTGHTPSNETGAMLDLNWSESFSEVKEVLPAMGTPALNLFYADRKGNIARFTMGKFPVRSGKPITLRTGWNPNHQWNGWVDFEDLPHEINPERGWIANANNELRSGTGSPYLATFWEPESRYTRISERLQTGTNWTVNDFKELQQDVFSHQAKDLLTLLEPAFTELENDSTTQQMITYLKNWDYNYSQNASAATIFDVFMIFFTQNTFNDELGKPLTDQLLRLETIPIKTMTSLIERSSTLFDNKETSAMEQFEDIARISMLETRNWLVDSLGTQGYQWRWENIHTLTLSPPLFAEAARDSTAPDIVRLIVSTILSRGPYKSPGNGLTINNAQYSWTEPFQQIMGPSIRRIVDLSDLRRTYSILAGGQSGIPNSAHFDDQIQDWLNGEYKELLQDWSLIQKEPQIGTMMFTPK